MKKDSKKDFRPKIKDGVAPQPNFKTGKTQKGKNARSPVGGPHKFISTQGK